MITLVSDGSTRARYSEELLAHAGLAWRVKDPAALSDDDRVILLAGNTPLDVDARERISRLVTGGAALVATGGTRGLDDLLGAVPAGAVGEGYIVQRNADHPVTAGLHEPLHVYWATPLRATSGTALARLADTSARTRTGDAVVANRIGNGATVTIGADIPASVLHIQAGTPVYADGPSAPDGTAALRDDILKAEDGHVLSWEHDRQQTLSGEVPECAGFDPAFPKGDTPWFSVPIADELRMLLFQALAWAAGESGHPLALLHEWPGGLDAVALISHDSDLNLDASAHTTLRLLDEAGIHSTWCHMYGPRYPNTYEQATFPKILDAGHEFALHYNALDKDGGAWGRDHFAWQADFVRKEAGVDGFVSNKNHYTRWEGHVDFFSWLVDEGIRIDQTRGPSKKGTVGYPHGTSLPTFPLDQDTGRFIDVLELPMQFQDLSLTTPPYMATTTRAQAQRHHGVAHYLFHQIHLHTKPDVAEAFLHLVGEVRDAGLAWWTSARINDWERQRREISVDIDGDQLTISSPTPVSGAVVDLLVPADRTIHRHGNPLDVTAATRWNRDITRVQLDLPAGETVLTLA